MVRPIRILMIEDSDRDAKLSLRTLRRYGFDPDVLRVETEAAMCEALTEGEWDVVLSDYSMPTFSGLAALAVLQKTRKDIPFIIVSGTIGEETAVEAMKAGAHDFIIKGRLARLGPAIDRELREAEDRRHGRAAQAEASEAQAALRQTEEQLRQAQKMEAIGSLAGGIAHDFNNLLSVILGFTDLVLMEHKNHAPTRRDLEEVRRAGGRAADLTRQLLAFSRRQVLQPKVVDLNATLHSTTRMLERVIGEHVELALAPGDDLVRVFVDPGQIEQVVMNLVVNARDAMPEGGKLTITTENANLDEAYAAEHLGAKPGRYAMLAVRDTGTGIDKSTLTRIFEPFFTTKDKGKGTGLGLSTVFGIVSQSGGSIAVDSEVGRGTTFKVYLPETNRIASTVGDTSARGVLQHGVETILLVEDDEQVRKLTRAILERNGYQVREAKNGTEALSLCEQEQVSIDLLLTDVVMPQMSGRHLADRVKVVRPSLKVVFMSGYTDDTILPHGVLEDGVPFVPKPLVPDALLRRVREVLDSPPRTDRRGGP